MRDLQARARLFSGASTDVCSVTPRVTCARAHAGAVALRCCGYYLQEVCPNRFLRQCPMLTPQQVRTPCYVLTSHALRALVFAHYIDFSLIYMIDGDIIAILSM